MANDESTRGGADITLSRVGKTVIFLAAVVAALVTLWTYQPFALAYELDELSTEVEAIKANVAMAEDVNELKAAVEQVNIRVELSDVKSEIREIGRVSPDERSDYMTERLDDLESERQQLEGRLRSAL